MLQVTHREREAEGDGADMPSPEQLRKFASSQIRTDHTRLRKGTGDN